MRNQMVKQVREPHRVIDHRDDAGRKRAIASLVAYGGEDGGLNQFARVEAPQCVKSSLPGVQRMHRAVVRLRPLTRLPGLALALCPRLLCRVGVRLTGAASGAIRHTCVVQVAPGCVQ
jgi:hypothetical protein